MRNGLLHILNSCGLPRQTPSTQSTPISAANLNSIRCLLSTKCWRAGAFQSLTADQRSVPSWTGVPQLSVQLRAERWPAESTVRGPLRRWRRPQAPRQQVKPITMRRHDIVYFQLFLSITESANCSTIVQRQCKIKQTSTSHRKYMNRSTLTPSNKARWQFFGQDKSTYWMHRRIYGTGTLTSMLNNVYFCPHISPPWFTLLDWC